MGSASFLMRVTVGNIKRNHVSRIGDGSLGLLGAPRGTVSSATRDHSVTPQLGLVRPLEGERSKCPVVAELWPRWRRSLRRVDRPIGGRAKLRTVGGVRERAAPFPCSGAVLF